MRGGRGPNPVGCASGLRAVALGAAGGGAGTRRRRGCGRAVRAPRECSFFGVGLRSGFRRGRLKPAATQAEACSTGAGTGRTGEDAHPTFFARAGRRDCAAQEGDGTQGGALPHEGRRPRRWRPRRWRDAPNCGADAPKCGAEEGRAEAAVATGGAGPTLAGVSGCGRRRLFRSGCGCRPRANPGPGNPHRR